MTILTGLQQMIQECRSKLFDEVDNKNLLHNNTSSKELLDWLRLRGYKLNVAAIGQQLVLPLIYRIILM